MRRLGCACYVKYVCNTIWQLGLLRRSVLEAAGDGGECRLDSRQFDGGKKTKQFTLQLPASCSFIIEIGGIQAIDLAVG